MLKQLILTMLLLLLLPGSLLAGGTLYKIYTNRMDCDYCAYDVEEKIRKIKGVVDFEVDIDGVFLVTTAEGVKLGKPAMKKLLLDNGFDYKGMTAQPLTKGKKQSKHIKSKRK